LFVLFPFGWGNVPGEDECFVCKVQPDSLLFEFLDVFVLTILILGTGTFEPLCVLVWTVEGLFLIGRLNDIMPLTVIYCSKVTE